MPRKPRIIKAKYKTKCPKCDFPVIPGTTCKVYANEWYHMDCWDNKWEEVLDKRDEEENKSLVDEKGKGLYVGLANSTKVSSSKLKGGNVGAKKKFRKQVKLSLFLEESDKDFIDEFGKNTFRSISEVLRLSINLLKKDYNEKGTRYGI